jgi:hypothetical protein
MHAMLSARVTDDDGVIVLASASALKERFASREFDYNFPRELVAAASAEELCAWETEEEGDVEIAIHAESEAPAEALFLGVLSLGESDQLLVMPYSQYTMACSRRGVPQDIPRLCTRLTLEAGRYAWWARRAPVGRHDEDAPDLAFDVYMRKASAADKPLRAVPKLAR